MKKVIVSLLALACVVILLVGCGLCVETVAPEPVAPNVRSPSIMGG